MKLKHCALFVLCNGILFWASANEPTPTELQNTIKQRNQTYLQSLIEGDAYAHGEIFAKNASVLFPGLPILKGREGIVRDKLATFKKVRILDGTIETVELEASGSLAYEFGHFTYDIQPIGGERRTIHGKYLVVWRKGRDGVWRIQVDAGLPTP